MTHFADTFERTLSDENLKFAMDPVERQKRYARLIYLQNMIRSMEDCKRELDIEMCKLSNIPYLAGIYQNVLMGIRILREEYQTEKKELESIR